MNMHGPLIWCETPLNLYLQCALTIFSTFSKIEAGKLELETIEFNLRDAIGKSARTLTLRSFDKGLELACRVAPDLPEVLVGDPGRLGQIIKNLTSNAIKFTEQGEVVINVAKFDPSRDSSAIVKPQGVMKSEEQITLHVSVRDTGIGIPEEKQGSVFQAFTQADASTTRHYGGTGLGLAISSQLVEMMNGRISMQSRVGEGSTFHFTVSFNIGANRPQLAPGSLRGMSALIVDDNATNRRILHEVLTNWQMLPQEAESGQAALLKMKQAATLGTPFRLVLVDLMMPDMDGFMLAERIRESELNPAMIMISSGVRPGDAERCVALRIHRNLLKPVIQSELLNSVLEVVGEAAVAQILAESPKELRTGKGQLNILLAEDGLVNQKVAVGLLKQRGHSVVIANNGLEALEALGRERFDLVLMDVHMPEMDGFAATAAIREDEDQTGFHIPIIAMTANAMKGDREKCLAAGMDSYVAKPVKPHLLFDAIEEFTAGCKKA